MITGFNSVGCSRLSERNVSMSEILMIVCNEMNVENLRLRPSRRWQPCPNVTVRRRFPDSDGACCILCLRRESNPHALAGFKSPPRLPYRELRKPPSSFRCVIRRLRILSRFCPSFRAVNRRGSLSFQRVFGDFRPNATNGALQKSYSEGEISMLSVSSGPP